MRNIIVLIIIIAVNRCELLTCRRCAGSVLLASLDWGEGGGRGGGGNELTVRWVVIGLDTSCDDIVGMVKID